MVYFEKDSRSEVLVDFELGLEGQKSPSRGHQKQEVSYYLILFPPDESEDTLSTY